MNAVCGGAVATENLHKGHGGDPYVESIEATVPMGRLADVADIANACRFLASPLGRFEVWMAARRIRLPALLRRARASGPFNWE